MTNDAKHPSCTYLCNMSIFFREMSVEILCPCFNFVGFLLLKMLSVPQVVEANSDFTELIVHK